MNDNMRTFLPIQLTV